MYTVFHRPDFIFCALLYDIKGFKPAKHMVFSGLYPADGSDFEALNHAIERLTCNDASVSVTKESSTALGLGFRYGASHWIFFSFPLLGCVRGFASITFDVLISFKWSLLVKVTVIIFLQMWFLRLTSHGCFPSAA